MTKRLTAKEAAALYGRLAADKPAPKTELDYRDPFTLLVAVVLSAQATDVGVNKVTGPLFAVADTPEKMIALGEARLGALIKTIGLWRGKAKNVIALSAILIERHQGRVPETREALEVLPGVGRKTANVVLNAAFGQPTLAIDTHVFRVANRTGLAPGKTPLAVELGLLKITPPQYLQHAHYWLILHGRYVCVARTPKCGGCPVADICRYEEKTGLTASATAATEGPPRPRLRGRGAKDAGWGEGAPPRTPSSCAKTELASSRPRPLSRRQEAGEGSARDKRDPNGRRARVRP